MDEIWMCPGCGYVGRPLPQHTPGNYVRGSDPACANCKSTRIVRQDSAIGRELSRSHGLQIPASALERLRSDNK